MLVGIDTGFFYALEEKKAEALQIWEKEQLIVSVITVYELEKSFLKGAFPYWLRFSERLEEACTIVPVNLESAMMASHISQGTGIPGLDALILASLLETGCKKILTRDPHFLRYKKKGIQIILLAE